MFVYSSYHLNISFSSSGSHFNNARAGARDTQDRFCLNNSKKWLFLTYSQIYAARAPIQIKLPKKYCQIFVPKKIPESKISNPKKSFYDPRHLKPRVPPPPPPWDSYLLDCSSLVLSQFSIAHLPLTFLCITIFFYPGR